MSTTSPKKAGDRPVNKATMDQPQEEFVEDQARPSHSQSPAPGSEESPQKVSVPAQKRAAESR